MTELTQTIDQGKAEERPRVGRGELARTLISTAGLTLLVATVWFARSLGQLQDDAALLATVALGAVGLVVAVLQRWRAMAHAAVGLGLVGQLGGVALGLGTLHPWPDLAAALAPLLLLALRADWEELPPVVVGAAWFSLLARAAAVPPAGGALRLWALAVAVIGAAGVVLSLTRLRGKRPAAAIAVTTGLGALLCLGPVFAQHVRWMLLPGTLVAGFGVLLHWSDRARGWPGPLLMVAGAAFCVVVGLSEGGGVILLVAALAGLSALSLILATSQVRWDQANRERTTQARREPPSSPWSALLGSALVAQVVTLAAGHPLLTRGEGTPWAPTWIAWSVAAGLTALQLALVRRWAQSPHVGQAPAWIVSSCATAALLTAGVAASTVLDRLSWRWPPLLTLAWAAAALLCFWLGRTRRALTALGAIAALASLVKLIAWDWRVLGLASRLLLLLFVSATLFVAPLLRPRHQDLAGS